MYQYMQAGGFIMWVIAALSVAAFAVAAERLFFFRRSSTDPERLEARFQEAMDRDDRGTLRSLLTESDSSLHRLFRVALLHWGIGREDMKLLIEQTIRSEIYRWEKHLAFLEVVGRIAPMLGLLGTVLGMVDMFASLNTEGQITATAVTGGIWKALFTTVAGLFVAIPVVFVYCLLTSRIDAQEECLNRGGDFLLRAHFAAPEKEGGRR